MQKRMISGEPHLITRYDVLLGLVYLSFLWGHQLSEAGGTNPAEECNSDSLGCCQSVCKLFSEIQDWNGKQLHQDLDQEWKVFCVKLLLHRT